MSVHQPSCEAATHLEKLRRVIIPGLSKDGREGWSLKMARRPPETFMTDCFIPMNVLSTLPVFFGHVTRSAASSVQIHGTYMCNHRQTVLAAAHLYTAATAQGSIKDAAISKQWREWKRLTPGQLLRVLREVFVEDEVALNYDHHGLHQRCMELMGYVAMDYIGYLGPDLGRKKMLGNPEIYDMVYDVLWDAADNEFRKLDQMTTVLYNAGQAIEDMLECERSQTIDEARSMSSGYITDALKLDVLFGPMAIAKIKDVAPLVHKMRIHRMTMFRTLVYENHPGKFNHYDHRENERIMNAVQSEKDGWAALGLSKATTTKRICSTINYRMYEANIPWPVTRTEPNTTDEACDTIHTGPFSKDDFCAAIYGFSRSSTPLELRGLKSGITSAVLKEDCPIVVAIPPEAWGAEAFGREFVTPEYDMNQ